MDSIQLTRELYQKGLLTKEAALEVLRARDAVVRDALFSESVAFFKEAGPGRFFEQVGKKMQGGSLTPLGARKAGKAVGWPDVAANLTKILALAGLMSTSAAGIHAVGRFRADRKLNQEIDQSYSEMKEQFPRIQEMDADKVRNHFNVLARYAPSLAANPTVAGAFVQTQYQRGLVDPATIKTLAQAQETIDRVRGHHKPMGLPLNVTSGLAQSALSGG